MTSYSLGFACTVRGVAGKLLRENLPTGAFRPMTGAVALVDSRPQPDNYTYAPRLTLPPRRAARAPISLTP